MARSERDTRPAPIGMATNAPISNVPQHLARYIKGFLPPKDGILERSYYWLPQPFQPRRIRGIGWFQWPELRYYNPDTDELPGRLIVWTNLPRIDIYRLERDTNSPNAPIRLVFEQYVTLTSKKPFYDVVDHSMAQLQPASMVPTQVIYQQCGNYMWFAYLPGSYLYCLRYLGNHIWDARDATPDTSEGYFSATSFYYNWGRTVPEWNFTPGETYKYRAVFCDEDMHYVGPHGMAKLSNIEGGTVVMGPDGIAVTVQQDHNSILVTLKSPDYARWKRAIVYRAAQGTNTYYATKLMPIQPRDGEAGYIVDLPPPDGMLQAFDVLPENQLNSLMIGPAILECAPPPPVSCLATHHDRLWCNDMSDRLQQPPRDDDAPRRVFVSHTNMWGAFNYNPYPTMDTAAMPLVIPLETADRIVAMHSLGDVLCVWSRDTLWTISGHSPEDYRIEYRAPVGCVSPLTVKEVTGNVVWLAKDGVYTLKEGFVPAKISEMVDNLIVGTAVWEPGAWEQNEGAWVR